MDSVAEYTIAQWFATMKRLYTLNRNAHRDDRRVLRCFDVQGSTLGLYGFGRIGQEVAQRAVPLLGPAGRLLVYDVRPDIGQLAAQFGAEAVAEPEVLFRECDTVSLHVSGDATIVGRELLELMQPHASLINPSRGNLVDDAAVHRAVEQERLYYYVVDDPVNGAACDPPRPPAHHRHQPQRRYHRRIVGTSRRRNFRTGERGGSGTAAGVRAQPGGAGPSAGARLAHLRYRGAVMATITHLQVRDIRFPTSANLDGSDAVHTDPDYSAAYVVLYTDQAGLEGHGITFTLGRGTEICIAAVRALQHLVVGRTLEQISADLRGFWRALTNDSQLRWIGPEKGAIHLATAALVNAVWDLYAKHEDKPLWRLLAEMTPEQLVACVDFR